VARKLTDAEIVAVSGYYASLPAGKPITPTSPAAVVAMISAASSKDVRTGDVPQRGEKIYNNKCAFSHGEQGQGAACPDGRILYPPLWSAEAYNWGAGMHNIDVAAAFIKHNMPFGLAGNLTDQEAWDVAAFMNSHERPQDPRFKGDLQDTMEKFHGSIYDYYGKRKSADGFLLGEWPAARK
jgi:thiosulfate dehydrogenase